MFEKVLSTTLIMIEISRKYQYYHCLKTNPCLNLGYFEFSWHPFDGKIKSVYKNVVSIVPGFQCVVNYNCFKIYCTHQMNDRDLLQLFQNHQESFELHM